ncbi:MAG TPA: hypothetical protein VI854_06180, partial [Acidimicrobiia bacterium]|nr:hypothetical protein [Acidimicrobiia bacterium]
AAAAGTAAAGRAAQLLVTLQNGESTVSFGLGFASARGRTILNEFDLPSVPGVDRPGGRLPPFRDVSGPQQPLRYGSATPFSGGTVDNVRSGFASRGNTAPRITVGPNRTPAATPSDGLFPEAAGGLPTTGLNVAPPPGQTAGETEAYGGDGPWLATIGGSIIALGLARYLAYSTALRPVTA